MQFIILHDKECKKCGRNMAYFLMDKGNLSDLCISCDTDQKPTARTEPIELVGRGMEKQRRKIREQSLPNNLSTADWFRAVNYFHNCCAVCDKPFKLSGANKAAADHWIPLASPDCTGTVTTNIVPLCHGRGGCNNSKKDKMPGIWLVEKYGVLKSGVILQRISDYFEWVRSQDAEKIKAA